MKKSIVMLALVFSFAFIPVFASAREITLSEAVEFFIKLGMIGGDKAALARSAVHGNTFVPTAKIPRVQEYTETIFGFSLFYPSSWSLVQGKGELMIDKNIRVQMLSNDQLIVADGAPGTTELSYDPVESWSQPEVFKTAGNLPVFISSGKNKTYIIPVTQRRFVVISNATADGVDRTAQIMTLAKTIAPANMTISNQLATELVGAEVKSQTQ